MLKIELHSHTADDPVDRIPHSSLQLIDRAAALGYDALAITLHERQLNLRRLRPYAAELGITLIPGIERSIGGRHVLLLNFSSASEQVRSFADLARLKRKEPGLVVAPHPYFPAPNCLLGQLDRHGELFDAVEYNAMFTATVNFNKRAERWARVNGKPLVGNCDVHRIEQLGSTYSVVDAEPDAEAICAAIRGGRVQVKSRPLQWTEAAGILSSMFAGDISRALGRRRESTAVLSPSCRDHQEIILPASSGLRGMSAGERTSLRSNFCRTGGNSWI